MFGDSDYDRCCLDCIGKEHFYIYNYQKRYESISQINLKSYKN